MRSTWKSGYNLVNDRGNGRSNNRRLRNDPWWMQEEEKNNPRMLPEYKPTWKTDNGRDLGLCFVLLTYTVHTEWLLVFTPWYQHVYLHIYTLWSKLHILLLLSHLDIKCIHGFCLSDASSVMYSLPHTMHSYIHTYYTYVSFQFKYELALCCVMQMVACWKRCWWKSPNCAGSQPQCVHKHYIHPYIHTCIRVLMKREFYFNGHLSREIYLFSRSIQYPNRPAFIQLHIQHTAFIHRIHSDIHTIYRFYYRFSHVWYNRYQQYIHTHSCLHAYIPLTLGQEVRAAAATKRIYQQVETMLYPYSFLLPIPYNINIIMHTQYIQKLQNVFHTYIHLNR